MSDSSGFDQPTPERRTFIQNALSSGAAIAGLGLLTGCATAHTNLGAQTAPESPLWDMSWQKKLGRYRTVYEAPDIDSGSALQTVALTIAGYKAALPQTAKEFTPVIVLRHTAAVMTLDDAMWERLGAAESNKLKDPTTGVIGSKRNPFATYTMGDRFSNVNADSSITGLMAQGAIIIACNRALNVLGMQLRRMTPDAYATPALSLAEIRKHVIPGVYVMPNGLFAVAAAQDAGCGYVRILPQ